MSSFLATILLGAWLLPGAWLSGAVVGLGLGLLLAAVVHLHHARGAGLGAPVVDPVSNDEHLVGP